MRTNLSGKHLIEQHSKRPPVHRLPIRLVSYDLRDTKVRSGRPFKGMNEIKSWLGPPQERCSPAFHRRFSWWSRRACFLYTCRSQLSLCALRRPASRCPASGPWEQKHTHVCGCFTSCRCGNLQIWIAANSQTNWPIHDALGMQEEESDGDLCSIEPEIQMSFWNSININGTITRHHENLFRPIYSSLNSSSPSQNL